MKRALLATIVSIGLCVTAFGEAQESARPLEQTADFWQEVRAPGQRRAATLTEHALRLVLKAIREAEGPRPRPHVRAALLEGAIQRLRLAREHAPRDVEVLFNLARTLAMFERPQRGAPPERFDEQAIAAFEELRSIDAGYQAEVVGFELGILYTRLGRYDRAADEYRRAVAQGFDVETTSVTHANLAEVRMMAGDLEDAVHHYEMAIRIAEQNPFGDHARSLALANWGRAVALDRLGEHRTSLESAQRAMSVYGGSMDVLRSPGVFFDPPAEIHYYEALGFMAKAQAAEPADRAQHLQQARASWRQYLTLSRDPDPWRSLAERHAEEVARALRGLGAERR